MKMRSSKIARFVPHVLLQGSMVLSAWHRVNSGPAVFTKVLETGDTGTVEWSWFVIALNTMAFITHLALQDIRLNLNLSENSR